MILGVNRRAVRSDDIRRDFRPDLEGLRGLAVALVVLFHARLLGAVGGFVGVDAFYVLSGFFITGMLLRELATTGRLDLVAFYGRRARRILPAASLAIVVILAFAAFIAAPLDLASIAVDATASGLFVGNLLFAARATDYFASSTPSPFLHYWSLGVEEQFYLVWPLLLVVAFRVRQVYRIAATLCLGSLALSIALTPVQAPWAFYSLPTRAWQLGLGALLALYGPALARLPSLPIAVGGWLGLLFLGIASLTLDPTSGYPGLAALLPTTGVALVVLATGRRGGPGPLLAFAPLRILGRISFSLYLYHWPVLVLASIAFGELSTALRWSFVGLSIVIAAASWRLVEQPFRRARGLLRGPRRSLGLAASAICVVGVAAQLVGLSGAPSVAARGDGSVSEVVLPLEGDTIQGARSSVAPPPAVAAVVEMVASAAPAASSVPRELRPRLVDARNDVDGLNERGCGLSLAGTQPPLCQLGAADDRHADTAVGDSHAAQWFPALEAIAKQRRWRLLPFTKDSCIFLDMRIISLNLEREYSDCARWREKVVSALQRARPDLVVVSSSRWVHPVDPADADPERQADAMVRLLKALPSRLAVIADTPLSAQDVPACLSRRDRTVEACGTPRSYALTAHLARDRRVADGLAAVLIDPSEWLCGPAVCPAVIDWTIAYRDDHHLTATMARRLAPLLEPGLLDALGSFARRGLVGAGVP
jgi:peptidoglycan/LPS O-acetylase OafA/YrhL